MRCDLCSLVPSLFAPCNIIRMLYLIHRLMPYTPVDITRAAIVCYMVCFGLHDFMCICGYMLYAVPHDSPPIQYSFQSAFYLCYLVLCTQCFVHCITFFVPHMLYLIHNMFTLYFVFNTWQLALWTFIIAGIASRAFYFIQHLFKPHWFLAIP